MWLWNRTIIKGIIVLKNRGALRESLLWRVGRIRTGHLEAYLLPIKLKIGFELLNAGCPSQATEPFFKIKKGHAFFDKKKFPPDRKRVLPVGVVKNFTELWLVVDQQKAWEKERCTKRAKKKKSKRQCNTG